MNHDERVSLFLSLLDDYSLDYIRIPRKDPDAPTVYRAEYKEGGKWKEAVIRNEDDLDEIEHLRREA